MNSPVHSRRMLAPSTVHLWRVALYRANAPGLTDVLSEDERRRAARYRFDHDRREFASTRAVLRRLLAEYNMQRAECLRFHYGERGKPEMDGGGTRFNVSHAGSMALIAVAQLEVGVDIARIDEHLAWRDIAISFLSQIERDWIDAQPQAQRAGAFFHCWTRREAYVKARGVALGTEESLGLNATVHADERLWSIHALKPFDGYVGAIAIEGDGDLEVQLYEW